MRFKDLPKPRLFVSSHGTYRCEIPGLVTCFVEAKTALGAYDLMAIELKKYAYGYDLSWEGRRFRMLALRYAREMGAAVFEKFLSTGVRRMSIQCDPLMLPPIPEPSLFVEAHRPGGYFERAKFFFKLPKGESTCSPES